MWECSPCLWFYFLKSIRIGCILLWNSIRILLWIHLGLDFLISRLHIIVSIPSFVRWLFRLLVSSWLNFDSLNESRSSYSFFLWYLIGGQLCEMKSSIFSPATSCQKLTEVADECKIHTFYEKYIATERSFWCSGWRMEELYDPNQCWEGQKCFPWKCFNPGQRVPAVECGTFLL